MQVDPNSRNRFFTFFVMREGCWVWEGTRNHKGYGVFLFGKRGRTGAHRASWQFHHGPIPEGKWVLHRCDNPACVNPDHLFLGDNAANVADKVAKGRCARMAGEQNPMWRAFDKAARGEKVGGATLKEGDVREIRRLSREGVSQNKLAMRFGVSQAQIWGILHRRSWRHVSDGQDAA